MSALRGCLVGMAVFCGLAALRTGIAFYALASAACAGVAAAL